jgi:hypothetical protein
MGRANPLTNLAIVSIVGPVEINRKIQQIPVDAVAPDLLQDVLIDLSKTQTPAKMFYCAAVSAA